jgi:hypothetical protein
MNDLVDLLWSNLRSLAEGILDLRARSKPPRPMEDRQLRALAWALIVLRSDPPAGEAATADTHLGLLLKHEPIEIRAEILSVFRSLP